MAMLLIDASISSGIGLMPANTADANDAFAMRVVGLNAYFGNTHAVRDISLDLPVNEVTAIIGPSGCGKSTFLRCLNRMHETIPLARVNGTVMFHGQDIYSDAVDPI